MCPECFATIALAITGAISTGTATVLRLFHNKKNAAQFSKASDRKEKST